MKKDSKKTRGMNFFGWPPGFKASYLSALNDFTNQPDKNFLRETPLEKFYRAEHPEVYLIPRDRFLTVVDKFGDPIGFEATNVPFSSYNFYVDRENSGIFADITEANAFHRLGTISQLGYLVPNEWFEEYARQRVYYLMPTFKQTRWLHSLITAALAEVILARNGFAREERYPFVITAACHDIATPAGGDSVMRIDREALSEEKNFSWAMKHHGLDKLWEEKYGFNLEKAQAWVYGEGELGKLLDFIDKISYVAIDCFHLGDYEGKTREFATRFPLVMDVWQTIRYRKGKGFYFNTPKKLYNFLYLRALEHQDLLLNPRSRALDFYITKYAGKLYREGVIKRDDLITKPQDWLNNILKSKFEEFGLNNLLSPDDLRWKKFKKQEDAKSFKKIIGSRLDHEETIKPFNTGLNFPVEKNGQIISLEETLAGWKTAKLKSIAEDLAGYYIYYHN